MKRWMTGLAAMALCLLFACAYADAKPMTKYQPGQRIDVGFNGDVAYMAGCELEDGTAFMLVDTDFFDGYLLVDSPLYYYDSIGGGIPIPQGWSAQVTAADAAHCTVTLSGAKETIRYHFSFVPAEVDYEQEWVLDRLERGNGSERFTADFDFWRADMTQTQNGQTETAVVCYEFFREANNLNFAKLPMSIEEGRRLEEAYPVAAVSPKDPTTRVNLREGPGTSHARCGSLYSGALLAIREIKDGWAKIYVGDTDAYISTEFLTFGAEIANVPDMRPQARIRDGEFVKVSRVPYWGGGGSVTQTRGGQEVRIIGEYNSQWRIADAGSGSYYVHADDVR